jgi:predicted nucleic acid-binding protein
LIYIDTSALLKLVWTEPQTDALTSFLKGATDARFVSSALLAVEARRGALRHDPRGLPRVELLLGDVVQVAVSEAVVERAGRLPDPSLRSLDAIHLATAMLIRDDVDVLLTYDHRLATAAQAEGVPTVTPV